MNSKFIIKILAPTLLLFCSTVQSCIVSNTTSEEVRNIVKQNGGWPVSDTQCALLNKYKLGLQVSAVATVLRGVNVGWATVRLISDTNIISDKASVSTNVDTSTASQPTAERAMYEAISNAIDNLDWQVAVLQIEKYRVLAKNQTVPQH